MDGINLSEFVVFTALQTGLGQLWQMHTVHRLYLSHSLPLSHTHMHTCIYQLKNCKFLPIVSEHFHYNHNDNDQKVTMAILKSRVTV